MSKRKKFPPDWKDASAYPDPEKASKKEILWEMLRRNPEYQRDYKLLKKVRSKGINPSHPTGYGFGNLVYYPQPNPKESLKKYLERIEKEGLEKLLSKGSTSLNPFDPFSRPFQEPLSQYLAKKWYISEMVDFKENDFKKMQFRPAEPVRIIGTYDEFDEPELAGFKWIFQHEQEVVLSLNLNKPIKKLLGETKSIIKELQAELKAKPSKSRAQFYHYPEYMRLLDAEDAGAKTKEMGIEIYPDLGDEEPDYHSYRLARERLKAAKRIINSKNFMFLLVNSKK